MLDRLEKLNERFHSIENTMSDPSVVSDQNKFRDLSKEHSQLSPIIRSYDLYKESQKQLAESKKMLETETDSDMKQMLTDEIDDLLKKIENLENELLIKLLPKDPNSGKNIIFEIRAGTGGEEAALFVADLLRMYTRYADTKGWKVELLEGNFTEIGGYKEIIFSIAGAESYDNLKYESGTHRVQRIPTTESGGRIHTSAVTVAVLPEAEERDIDIDPNDLRIDVYRASGHGGQSVNTTDSAVRITHVPTGLVVTCQDEKSQHKNKAKALRVLRTRLYEKEMQAFLEKESALRKLQVGSGDRSERIRTYNYPQSRVTDHRIGLTLYNLESFLEGNIDEIVEELKKNEINLLLKEVNE